MTDRTYPSIIDVAALYPHYDELYVTATTDGEHAAHSYHKLGEAVDFGSGNIDKSRRALALRKVTPQQAKDEFARWWKERFTEYTTELIHTYAGDHGGVYVKDGHTVAHGFYGKTTDVAHENHVHVAIKSTPLVFQLLHSTAYKAAWNQKNVADVRGLQAALGVVQDGIVGPKTVAAIMTTQHYYKLTVDGLAGPKTLAALKK